MSEKELLGMKSKNSVMQDSSMNRMVIYTWLSTTYRF